MGLSKQWEIKIGEMKPGRRNLITDVEGVRVGQVTIDNGNTHTGVTAVLPHPGNLFQDKVMAASQVLNGFGKTIGLVEVDEMGFLETPILLTNTFGVGAAANGLIDYMLDENTEIGRTTGTVNPVVCECNDGRINDIRKRAVTEAHAREAIARAAEDFSEGDVGAGRGMVCHQLKGGIGSASRTFEIGGQEYTLGALVLSNHGLYQDLLVAGRRISEEISKEGLKKVSQEEQKNNFEERDKGSIIMILATDAPLNERQLKRICRRCAIGLGREGSYMMNGSGDIALAFTTANRIPHTCSEGVLPVQMLHDDQMDTLFRASAEVIEESVLSSMFHAKECMERSGKRVCSLADLWEMLV